MLFELISLFGCFNQIFGNLRNFRILLFHDLRMCRFNLSQMFIGIVNNGFQCFFRFQNNILFFLFGSFQISLSLSQELVFFFGECLQIGIRFSKLRFLLFS